MIRPILLLLCAICLLSACQDAVIRTPKPRSYPRVMYPEKGFQPFDDSDCPFTFDYPSYSVIDKDQSFFGDQPAHPCWFDIYTKDFDSRVHCSYYPINAENPFDKLRNDAFTLAYKHVVKANAIEEIPLKNPQGVSGFTFNLEGPVATSFMFYLTDSTDHFLQGSLYFNTKARPDSLAPIFDFLKEDLLHLVETFEWE